MVYITNSIMTSFNRASHLQISWLTWLTKFNIFQDKLYIIQKKILPKSTCLTHYFTCPRPSANGIGQALYNYIIHRHFHMSNSLSNNKLPAVKNICNSRLPGKQLQYHWVLYHFTHWGWVMHISISKLTIIGSDNGLSPYQRQAIIWNNAGIFLIRPLGTKLGEILIKTHVFTQENAFENLSVKWWSFCYGLTFDVRDRVISV